MAKKTTKTKVVSKTPPSQSRSLATDDKMKIQALLKSKASGEIAAALRLMEAPGITTADYDAVFTKSVMQAVLQKKAHQSWAAVVRALSPHAHLRRQCECLAAETVLRIHNEIPCDTIRVLAGHRFPATSSSCGAWPGLLWYQGWLLTEHLLIYKGSDVQLIDNILTNWDAYLPCFGDGVEISRITLSSHEREAAEYFVHFQSGGLLQWTVGNRDRIIAEYEQD
jgi:hypothetical protein